jgi:uncharacterized membrane protein required for colicin V production
MVEFSLLDASIAVLLLLAVLRGIWIGLLREGFSIVALAAGCMSVRYGAGPGGEWLAALSQGQIGAAAAPWIAGTAIGIASVMAVGMAGGFLRRGARAAGLGWADRAGGAALGAAEGAVVAAIVVAVALLVVGRDHPAVAGARSVAAFDAVREAVDESGVELPAVAAPLGELAN